VATIATHPLIVAKTMLQSKPPDRRKGKVFNGITGVLAYVMRNEGAFRLYKGLSPQIMKGIFSSGTNDDVDGEACLNRVPRLDAES